MYRKHETKQEKPLNLANLAIQIRDSVCRHVAIVPQKQKERVLYCRGTEEITNTFLKALSCYPPSILRLPMSVVTLDIANFNELVETSGTRRMKRVINRISPAIRHAVREADIVVRYGRTKFTILLIGADEQMAASICMRIKESVLFYSYVKLGLEKQLFLDFVIAEHRPNFGNDLAELVFRNERNIRVAKCMIDGVILRASELGGGSHRDSNFHLGDPCVPQYLFLDMEK